MQNLSLYKYKFNKFLVKYLSLPKESVNWKLITAYIIIAYLVSVAIRLILLYQIWDKPEFWYEGRPLPIWTDDAAAYGAVAKRLLEGEEIGVQGMLLGYLEYVFAKTTGLHIDWIVFVLPVFMSSLIVIPIILAGALFRLQTLSFFASIIGAISGAYYMRTHMGYGDTDMLVVYFAYMISVCLIGILRSKNSVWYFVGAIHVFIFYYWHHAAHNLIFGSLFVYFGFLFLFYRSLWRGYVTFGVYFLLTLFLWKLSYNFSFIVSLLISFSMVVAGRWMTDAINPSKKLLTYGSIVVVIFAALLLYKPLYEKLSSYKDSNSEKLYSELQGADGKLMFFDAQSTVAEAQKQSLESSINEAFGKEKIFFYSAVVSAFLIAFRYPIFYIIGFWLFFGISMGSFSGVRFGIFASPIGVFFLLLFCYYIFAIIKRVSKYYFARFLFLSIISLPILYTNFSHIIAFNKSASPRNITPTDVKLLELLDSKLPKETIVWSWWDFGHILHYYTHFRTVVDNGSHGAEDLYLISNILHSPSQTFSHNALKYFSYNIENGLGVGQYFFKQQNWQEIYAAFYSKEIKFPNTKAPILVYLPDTIIPIANTMREFSLRDPLTNDIPKEQLELLSGGQIIDLSNLGAYGMKKIEFDSDKGYIHLDDNKRPLSSMRVVDKELKKINKPFKHENRVPDYFAVHYKQQYLVLGRLYFYDNLLYRALFFDDENRDYFQRIGQSKNSVVLLVK